ncbi:MAG: 16S rRNA (cytosine(1402)-N(4))-methyltransferase RsmH, partial [Candidatus Krumholzibacteria bacterium]|nr:16S rRNA (cytosine(1402)-N(4))-methyltransferase RsmH [Candidatus Krumholzibacteria bacterium]
MSTVRHTPVLAETAVELLCARGAGFIVDGTIGTGGHAELILSVGSGSMNLLGIDRDPVAVEEARERLSPFGTRVTLACGNFRKISDLLGGRMADGFLLDLGLSTYQLSDATRGFSYLSNGPLDMMMGKEGRSVEKFISRADEREITDVLREYGEERRSRAIAREIVRFRTAHGMRTTLQLREAVTRIAPREDVNGTLSRVFQALRIWANEELESLAEFLPQAVECSNPGGRIVIISYHSLEDRIVKRFFRQEERGCTCPEDFPECRCGKV